MPRSSGRWRRARCRPRPRAPSACTSMRRAWRRSASTGIASSCGDAQSPVGRTRTAPAPDAAVARLRFALGACQNYEHGFYAAHREIAGRELDFVLFAGDYIYEGSSRTPELRRHGAPIPTTLDGYRARHALYKRDADLQAAHAAHPWILTWDDHEVVNDYATTATRPTPSPASSCSAAPRPTAPTSSTCRLRCRRKARRCASTTASPGAGWPSSGLWTAASTAATMPARDPAHDWGRLGDRLRDAGGPGAHHARRRAVTLAGAGPGRLRRGNGSCSASPRR